MKSLLVIFGGVALTITTFMAGGMAATYLLTAEPERVLGTAGTEGLWTDRPVRVDVAAQALERLPARTRAEPAKTASGRAEPVQAVDTVTTAAISAAPAVLSSAGGNPAHRQWCADRYRSYRADDNSYTSYSGIRRQCASPHSKATTARDSTTTGPAMQMANAVVEDTDYIAEVGPNAANWEHAERCMSRYRSYRPEDNSYQPYGGGPRQQCR